LGLLLEVVRMVQENLLRVRLMAVYYGANWRYVPRSNQPEALKECKQCRRRLPLRSFRISETYKGFYERDSVCIECETKPREVEENSDFRKCDACKRVKPIEEFLSKTGKGYTSNCRNCLEKKAATQRRYRTRKKPKE